MAVNPPRLKPPLPVPGFRVGIASCGVKSPELRGKRTDLTLIATDVNCHAAGVFTKNMFRAACVKLGERVIGRQGTQVRGIVVSSGNANAGVGIHEEGWARMMIDAAAQSIHVRFKQILSASTGVIGTPFPIERICEGMQQAAGSLSPGHWEAAADAIRTTDTFAKWASRKVGDYTITGICKGSGMIHPNMATMLAFIATDAPLAADSLQHILKRVVDKSFNSISVDGDTSTNDTVYLLSSGIGLGIPELAHTDEFEAALGAVCVELAQMIVRDGEGVSRFITINVEGAKNEDDARTVGRAIAVSLLVKTAFAGGDANWGRILSAIGNSGITIETHRISLRANNVTIVQCGNPHPDYRDEDGMAVFANDEFTLYVCLGMGEASATVWTGDLTHEYIRINAEYRT